MTHLAELDTLPTSKVRTALPRGVRDPDKQVDGSARRLRPASETGLACSSDDHSPGEVPSDHRSRITVCDEMARLCRRSEATARAMDSSTWNGMVLRTGDDGDAAAAAALHAGQISEGFLTFLGPRFLRRLYRRVTRTPGCFLLVVEDEGETVGFLAGSTDVAGLYRSFVWRDGIAAALASAGRLLRSWRQVMETLRHGTGSAGEGAELLAVAVDPMARGRGAGTLLVEGFLTEVGRRRRRAAHVVVAADNETAVALYRRTGFHPVQRFELHSGTESLLMQWRGQPDTES
jgi:ribosomal protein S18 acetylase RimI-like enzyme